MKNKILFAILECVECGSFALLPNLSKLPTKYPIITSLVSR